MHIRVYMCVYLCRCAGSGCCGGAQPFAPSVPAVPLWVYLTRVWLSSARSGRADKQQRYQSCPCTKAFRGFLIKLQRPALWEWACCGAPPALAEGEIHKRHGWLWFLACRLVRLWCIALSASEVVSRGWCRRRNKMWGHKGWGCRGSTCSCLTCSYGEPWRFLGSVQTRCSVPFFALASQFVLYGVYTQQRTAWEVLWEVCF